jgi:hypothetical protein
MPAFPYDDMDDRDAWGEEDWDDYDDDLDGELDALIDDAMGERDD